MINDRLMTFDEIIENFKPGINYLNYLSLTEAILKKWKELLKSDDTQKDAVFCNKYKYLGDFEKVSKIVYEALIENANLLPSRHKLFSNRIGGMAYNEYIKCY